MMNCYVVKDLLPNHIEGLLSEETAEDVRGHLETCEACQTLHSQMKAAIPAADIVPETNRDEINFLKKIKSKMVKMKIAEWVSWALTLLIAVAIAFFITHVIVVNAVVPSGSMENTIMTGDRVVANRLAYLFGEPQRFDIVVFPYPDNPSELFIKRIIGLPGETVEIKDGNVFIDGEQIQDSQFLDETPIGDFGPYVVPEGHYFMMGDNRNHSNDSRFWNNKFVDEKDILGKAVFKYWPGFKIIK